MLVIGKKNIFYENVEIGKECTYLQDKNDKINITIGDNNLFGNNVIIHKNVKIGNNNKIYDDTIIYPNTVIGNNNIILRNNVIGEVAVQASDIYFNYKDNILLNGLNIGDNNIFHCDNIIFSGTNKITIIGNNNRILGGCYIHHDTEIQNNICLYPRVNIAGYCLICNNSGIGMNSSVHQHRIIGEYSFIGMNNIVTKNIFPFFITINNKPIRLNKKRVPRELHDKEDLLKEIYIEFINKKKINLLLLYKSKLSITINKVLHKYYSKIGCNIVSS